MREGGFQSDGGAIVFGPAQLQFPLGGLRMAESLARKALSKSRIGVLASEVIFGSVCYRVGVLFLDEPQIRDTSFADCQNRQARPGGRGQNQSYRHHCVRIKDTDARRRQTGNALNERLLVEANARIVEDPHAFIPVGDNQVDCIHRLGRLLLARLAAVATLMAFFIHVSS